MILFQRGNAMHCVATTLKSNPKKQHQKKATDSKNPWLPQSYFKNF